MNNIVWQSAPSPSNVAEAWEWPCALYNGPGKKLAAMIVSPTNEQCSERGLRVGPSKPLRVIICKYNGPPGRNGEPYRKMMPTEVFTDLQHLMGWTQVFLQTHPDWQPKII